MSRGNTGNNLNRRWGVGAKHALYSKDGEWYHHLRKFPGVLFDKNGYIIFNTKEEYLSCPYLQHGTTLHITNGIASIPSYKKMIDTEEGATCQDQNDVTVAFEMLLKEIGSVTESIKDGGDGAIRDYKLILELKSMVSKVISFMKKIIGLQKEWDELHSTYTNYIPQTTVTVPEGENDLPFSPETQETADNEMKTVVAAILEEHFPNGIRPKSLIDINKLKGFYSNATGGKSISTNVAIPSLLNAIGILHGEKVYAVSSSGKNRLEERLKRLIAKDNRMYYYDEFYDVHADFFQEMNIFSSELLKTVLSAIFPSLHYTKNYFSTRNDVSIESEVLRCFDAAVCLSYEQLKVKLLYVPLDKIKRVLVQNSDFIWVSTGVYTHVSKVEIEESERDRAKDKIIADISEGDFASLASLDVSASLELNPDLSETAVRNGLFQICFADRYEKRGNIITLKGMPLNTVAVFKDYCLTHDRLTLAELLDFEKEINGRVHSQSLFVAYDTMVRVDKDTFVGDSEIGFNIEATDNALALFIHTDVIPLQAVTSFTQFPHIDGYPWNWYLLESYCKRFSKRFMYQCLSVNSRNVGAIFRRSAGFKDYIDVLAAAVAVSNVELDEKAVGDFLFERRYIAQRTASVSKVTAKARILRERKF